MLPQRANNYLAPAVFNGLSSITPQYDDKDHGYVSSAFTLTANESLTNQATPIDKDSDFIWTAVLCNPNALPFAARFSDSTGYYLSDTYIGSFAFVANMFGVGVPWVLPVPRFLPAGSSILVDLIDQSGVTNGPFQFIFRGYKRFYTGQ